MIRSTRPAALLCAVTLALALGFGIGAWRWRADAHRQPVTTAMVRGAIDACAPGMPDAACKVAAADDWRIHDFGPETAPRPLRFGSLRAVQLRTGFRPRFRDLELQTDRHQPEVGGRRELIFSDHDQELQWQLEALIENKLGEDIENQCAIWRLSPRSVFELCAIDADEGSLAWVYEGEPAPDERATAIWRQVGEHLLGRQ